MRIRGLRKSIALDFVLLLATGMLLLNFLIINLWQQFAGRQQLKQAEETLGLLVDAAETDCAGITQAVLPYTERISQSLGEIYIFDNGDFSPDGGGSITRIEQTVRLAGYSGTDIMQTGESEWTYLGMRTRRVILAKPVMNCKTRSALGLVVNMEKVHDSISEKQQLIVVYILLNIIILATIGFFRMRKLIISPLENLVGLAGSYRADSGELLTLTSRGSEFRHIAQALNSMISRIEEDRRKLNTTILSLETANEKILADQKSLIEAEKFAAVGRLSAGLAHEIGNPLGIIQGYVELLSTNELDPQERKQYTERAQKELNRVTGLIQQLLHFARKKREAGVQSPVYPVIREIVGALQHQKIADNVQFTVVCKDSDASVLCSEADMYQVFLNCLLNAIDAIRERDSGGGEISISGRVVENEEREFVEIRIQDDGSGVKDTDLDLVFDPFFTTKEVGQGTGLGLSVSRNIVESCGGSIRLKSDAGTGACVIIHLPCA